MKNLSYISIFISVLALSVSIGCLCHILPRELGIDHLGWIVGVLALLTTILLGWQIFSIFNIHEMQNKMKDMKNEAYLKSEDSLIELHGVMASTIYSLMNNNFNSELFANYLLNCLQMIVHLYNVGQYNRCEQNINSILNKIEPIEELEVPIRYQAGLTALITKVSYLPNISRGREVLKILLVVKFR